MHFLKKLNMFYCLCNTGSTGPSVFHVQGQRGRKHLHTQGKAIKLNGTMEKKKPSCNLVCVSTLLMVIRKCCLIKEQFPGYCAVNWIFLGYWVVSQFLKIFNLETAAARAQKLEIVCRCTKCSSLASHVLTALPHSPWDVPCVWHCSAHPTGTGKADKGKCKRRPAARKMETGKHPW